MKIAFFWTWDFSKNILSKVYEDKSIEIALIVSQPDKPVWREKEFLETPVKSFAKSHLIEVLQPEKLRNNEEFFEKLRSLNLDFIVVVAYGKIVPKEVLNAPKYGCINIHWSILPKYRWASPIQESLKNWDKLTWLTIMYMSEWMDEWDVLKVEEINVDIVDKTLDIFRKFEEIWPKLLIETLNWIINWIVKWTPQDSSKATYCSKIEKEDWEIKFTVMNSDEIYNKFRAYYTWPGIYTYFEWKKLDLDEVEIMDSWKWKLENYSFEPWKVIKIDKNNIWIVCADKNLLILKQIKLAGKKSMDINSFINWNKWFLDYKFE